MLQVQSEGPLVSVTKNLNFVCEGQMNAALDTADAQEAEAMTAEDRKIIWNLSLVDPTQEIGDTTEREAEAEADLTEEITLEMRAALDVVRSVTSRGTVLRIEAGTMAEDLRDLHIVEVIAEIVTDTEEKRESILAQLAVTESTKEEDHTHAHPTQSDDLPLRLT
jgi:hypothetical protein